MSVIFTNISGGPKKIIISKQSFNNVDSLIDNCIKLNLSELTKQKLIKAVNNDEYNILNNETIIDKNSSIQEFINNNNNDFTITFRIKESMEELDGGSKQKVNKSFTKKLRKYSNPQKAQRMAYKYLGKSAKLYPARNPVKKYSIYDPKNEKWTNFGQIGYEDYTKHKDKKRRKSYLTRSRGMLGNWKRNKYSANNLSIHILW